MNNKQVNAAKKKSSWRYFQKSSLNYFLHEVFTRNLIFPNLMETCHFISLFLKMSFFLFFPKFAHDIWQKMRSLLPFSSRFPPRCASCRSDRSGNAQRFITKSGTFQMVHLIVTAAQPHGAFFWSHALLRIKKKKRSQALRWARGARGRVGGRSLLDSASR